MWGLSARALLLVLTGVAAAGEEPACHPEAVWLVRHAEKVTAAPDPALSARGAERARALARRLGAAGIDAIYSTDFRRTRQTAEPLASHTGVDVTLVAAAGAAELAARVRSSHCGERVLIVGHSNTVPALLGAFGIDEPVFIDEATGYGDLFELRWSDDRPVVERSRFGD